MSYAVQPARRVASKKGDFRYHGPKYSVALFSSISVRSFTISASVRAHGRPGAPGPRLNLRSAMTRMQPRFCLMTCGELLNKPSGASGAPDGGAEPVPTTPGSACPG